MAVLPGSAGSPDCTHNGYDGFTVYWKIIMLIVTFFPTVNIFVSHVNTSSCISVTKLLLSTAVELQTDVQQKREYGLARDYFQKQK
jgi:hypothetical protein